MADQRNGGISWCDESWNPIRGCSRVSEGCRNCYAERVAHRFSGEGQPYAGLVTDKGRWSGAVRFVPERLADPLRWRRPRRVFVNSMSDLFHESLTNGQIAAVFGVMAAAPQHTFQVLTKRPERAVKWHQWASSGRTSPQSAAPLMTCTHEMVNVLGMRVADRARCEVLWKRFPSWPLPNVWLGVSVEDQATADERIPLLLQCPAAVRWVSAEPLLGPVELPRHDQSMGRSYSPLDWVVVGGESGLGARPMHATWARSLRDQCQAAGVAFHFKQWGEWAPWIEGGDQRYSEGMFWTYDDAPVFRGEDYTGISWPGRGVNPSRQSMVRVGKKAAGRELDGVTHDEWPEPTTHE